MSCRGVTLKGDICERGHWLRNCCGNCRDHCDCEEKIWIDVDPIIKPVRKVIDLTTDGVIDLTTDSVKSRCIVTDNFVNKYKMLFEDPSILQTREPIPLNIVVLLKELMDDKYDNKDVLILVSVLKVMDSLMIKKEYVVKLLRCHKIQFYGFHKLMTVRKLSTYIQNIVFELYVSDIDEQVFETTDQLYGDNKADRALMKVYNRINNRKNALYKKLYMEIRDKL